MINYLEAPGNWKPGIYELESYEHYASIPALRSSELKKMSKTPAHYKAAQEYKNPISPKLQRSFDRGKAFDILIIDGQEAFTEKVVIEPAFRKNTNDYKNWKSHLPKGSIALSEQDYNFILKMRDRAFSKKCFSDIFNGPGSAHRAIVWQCSRTGIWCKAEIDWICDEGTVVDLKTAASADFWFFSRQAYRLNYPHQGAFYLDGLTHITGIEHANFKLAVVETDPPFESNVFNVGPGMLDKAFVENELRMENLKKCLERDEWPGYIDQIIDLDSGQHLFEELENDQYDTDDLLGGF